MVDVSLCDVCISPGACCTRMKLTGRVIRTSMPGGDLSPHESMSRERAEHAVIAAGLPFIPSHQNDDGQWAFSCTRLQANGRCGVYEDRPQLCRDFKAGSDPLCVHFWADEAA